MNKKRITVIISDLGFGGAQNMMYEQLKNMDYRRFDVQVLCCGPRKNSDLEAKMEALCPVTYLNHCGRVTPWSVVRILFIICKTNPHIVHSHIGADGFAAVWGRLFRKPLVITVHAKPSEAFSTKTEPNVIAALKNGNTRLVAVSADNANRVRGYFHIDEHLCYCVNNGIDLRRFARKEHRGFTIINVGRHDENKNQAALIRCFAKLHKKHTETKLLLLGDGNQHQKLIKLAEELEILSSVTFTGNVSNTEDYYAISDLCVLCSHQEAMPLAVLEAMAAGLPIVATNVGGLSDVVLDNGILVADNDENALFEAMEKIYNQTQEETEKMCVASNRIVQNYSSKAMARAYENIYSEMFKR